MQQYFVYILRCQLGAIYIGYTSDLKRRIEDHQLGIGCLFTKNKRPVRLVYYEVFDSYELAIKREKQIKGWIRTKKENLIKYGKPYI